MSGFERAAGGSRTAWNVAALSERLDPELRALEDNRQKILAKRKEGWSNLGIAGLICAAVAAVGLLVMPPFGVLFGIVGFAVAGLVIHGKYFGTDRADYEHAYKRRIIGGMTRALEPEMTYHPERGLPESWFRASGLYPGDIDRYTCEDLFEGRIGKTSLWLSEVHAEDKRTRTDSKGRTKTYWVTIFKGLLVAADFHKHFKSEVTVMPDFAEAAFGSFGRMLQKIGRDPEYMENPEFEKAFVVHADDPVEARYILTPDMQERMVALRGRLGEDVRFAFRDSHVYMTIPNREDWFEPDLHHPAADRSQMQSFLAQMAACFQIVEDLNLNTRIWTKE